MPRFFLDFAGGGEAVITGADAAHIAKSLRMRPGDPITLCDGRGTDYAGVIKEIGVQTVTVRVEGASPTLSEPSLAVTLYQGLPKGDKMDFIVQKAVELGVTAIVPVATRRSVVRLDDKADRKRERWQRIADEAAGQCGRGILPQVEPPVPFSRAVERLREETAVILYEGGGRPLRELVSPGVRQLSMMVGPEGGFEPDEVEAVREAGGAVATLGPRILRCETAPLAALAVAMQLSGNLE